MMGKLNLVARNQKNTDPATASFRPTANHSTAKYAATMPQMMKSAMRANVAGGGQ